MNDLRRLGLRHTNLCISQCLYSMNHQKYRKLQHHGTIQKVRLSDISVQIYFIRLTILLWFVIVTQIISTQTDFLYPNPQTTSFLTIGFSHKKIPILLSTWVRGKYSGIMFRHCFDLCRTRTDTDIASALVVTLNRT